MFETQRASTKYSGFAQHAPHSGSMEAKITYQVALGEFTLYAKVLVAFDPY